MRNFYTLLAMSGILVTGAVSPASATKRIPIVEEKPMQIFALGADNGSSSPTSGVYQINLNDIANPVRLSTGYIQYTGSKVGGAGVFLSDSRVIGIKYNYSYLAYDATAEGNDEEGPWGSTYFKSVSGMYNVNGMTYDEQSDKVYVLYKDSDSLFASYNLGVYNPDTHTATAIGGPGTTLFALASAPDGTLWAIGSYGAFYTIDKSTGKATKKGDCSIQFQTGVCISASIDPDSGEMYVLAKNGYSDTSMSLTKVNLNDLSTEVLGTLPGYYNALTIIGSAVSEGAPAEVENLSAEYNGEKTVISFTAPTLTKGGQNLSGTLNYSITSDGEEVATGEVAPGAAISVDLDLADGPHSIGVSVSNDEGAGKAANTTVFSGYDTPTAVSNLKTEVNGETVNLTWDAPTGANGGEVNTSKLSYTVSRNGEILAEGLTEPSYTAVVTDKYLEYTFSIAVIYNDEEVNSTSISTYAGAAWVAPYTINLDEASLGLTGIQAVDPNTGNTIATPTWVLNAYNGENSLYSYTGYYYARTEFAYLPLTALKAGVEYTLSFEAAAYVDNDSMLGHYTKEDNPSKATLNVLLATAPDGNASDATNLATVTVMPKVKAFDFEAQTVTFTVETDGNYYIAIEEEAEKWKVYHSFRVKNISLALPPVEKDLAIALVSAPEENVAPAGDGKIIVKVTNNADLAVEADAYEVTLSRDGEVVATQGGEALEPGEEKEYTFELSWAGELPATVDYVASVVFEGDENDADNTTEAITVTFEKPNSVDSALAEGVVISVEGNNIIIAGAETMQVVICTADGKVIANTIASDNFSSGSLASGVYVVNVAGKSVKVVL